MLRLHSPEVDTTRNPCPLHQDYLNFLLKNVKCLKNSKVAKKSEGVDKKRKATCRETLFFSLLAFEKGSLSSILSWDRLVSKILHPLPPGYWD